jgi:hypothetical protein
MGIALLMAIMFTTVTGCIIYLFVNIRLQIRAKNRLEVNLKRDYKKLLNEIRQMPSFVTEEEESELLIMMLRKEIENLNNNTDKKVLQKTLDKKNFNNQKSFVKKVFSESGLSSLVDIKKLEPSI